MAKGLKIVRVKLEKERTIFSNEAVTNAAQAVKVMGEFVASFPNEILAVMNLDAKCRPINANIAAIGAVTYCSSSIPEIFRSAILSSACSVLVMHNHPSGIVKPSSDDVTITAKMIAAGKLIGIEMVDHIIVGNKDGELVYRSLKQSRDFSPIYTDVEDRYFSIFAQRLPVPEKSTVAEVNDPNELKYIRDIELSK